MNNLWLFLTESLISAFLVSINSLNPENRDFRVSHGSIRNRPNRKFWVICQNQNITRMTSDLFNLDLPNSASGRKSTIPSVGFGCWKLPKETASDLVFRAIEIGYRHIDSACDYGNEKEVILSTQSLWPDLAKLYKSLSDFWRFISYLTKCLT